MLMTRLTESEALDLLAECFNEAAGSLRPDTARDAIPGWDSMGALMFMAELDERFGVELDAETSRSMSSVGDALRFLRERGLLEA
jgi:acyl carrier protein